MSTNKQDPLIESLMALAVSAAPLIRRARESGIFRTDPFASKASEESVVEATVAKPAPAADTSALEGILIRQAKRIAELEAEVEALKAQQQVRAAGKKPAARKKPAK